MGSNQWQEGEGVRGGTILHVLLISSVFIHPRCSTQSERKTETIDLCLAFGQMTKHVCISGEL